MNTEDIIQQIDIEISKLQQAKLLLDGPSSVSTIKRGAGRPKKSAIAAPTKPKRVMSAEGRAKVAAAQKVRWANVRKAAKKAT